MNAALNLLISIQDNRASLRGKLVVSTLTAFLQALEEASRRSRFLILGSGQR